MLSDTIRFFLVTLRKGSFCTRSARFSMFRLVCDALCVSGVMLLFVLSAHAQSSVILPAIGGSGGGQFIARCPESQHLTGLELRTGDDVDAIRPLCVKAYGPRETNPPSLTSGTGLVTVFKSPLGLDTVKLEAGWYGGTGGGLRNVVCPKDTPIVIGMSVGVAGKNTRIVHNIDLFCGVAAAAQKPSGFPGAVYDGPAGYALISDKQSCPVGLVAVGINGRSGIWVDSVGLICGEPKLQDVVKATGRTKAPGDDMGGTPRSICELAREARARNSPAAPGLEAQCRAAGAAGEKPPVKAVGRVNGAPPADIAPQSICELARQARARNSPAAPGLEAQCRAAAAGPPVDGDDLAARGEAIANQDPLAVELRYRQAEGPSRRGFDIGMAAAEGQTAPGPGKQRIQNSLSPAEQPGFNIAVTFSLERNRNADLAAKGAAIAAADPVVAEARTVDADVFYWLGFDIATGIFGDPTLGALGNTAMGPGSAKIRDALNASGQRGFNASVKFHLSRKY